MSEQTVYDTFTFTGPCGCVVSVKGGKEQAHACVSDLTDAFMATWDPRGGGVASRHAVESMRAALEQTGWRLTNEHED